MPKFDPNDDTDVQWLMNYIAWYLDDDNADEEFDEEFEDWD